MLTKKHQFNWIWHRMSESDRSTIQHDNSRLSTVNQHTTDFDMPVLTEQELTETTLRKQLSSIKCQKIVLSMKGYYNDWNRKGHMLSFLYTIRTGFNKAEMMRFEPWEYMMCLGFIFCEEWSTTCFYNSKGGMRQSRYHRIITLDSVVSKDLCSVRIKSASILSCVLSN